MTLVLIDGRSGSGKTELARAIAAVWPGVSVVHMDDLYPGWDGLEAGSAYLLEALAAGEYARWDWTLGARAERHRLGRPLIVEGVGSITPATRELADTAIWVDLDESTRRQRALARDEYFAEHWVAWAEQELAHIARNDPALLADTVVDGGDVGAGVEFWRSRF